MGSIIWSLLLTGCRTQASPDLTGFGDTPIVVSGLADGEFVVTPNELAELELTSSSASGVSAKAGTVRATGPTLRTFLANYGFAPEDVVLVRFIAKDGYRVTLHENGIRNWNVILSLTPLSEDEQPLRLLIPESESGQWIYGIVRMEFILAEDAVPLE